MPVHLGVLRRREVEHAPVLGPDDDGPQGVSGPDDQRLLGSLDQTTTVRGESLPGPDDQRLLGVLGPDDDRARRV